MNNQIKIDGNGNITIQDAAGATISINTTDANDVIAKLQQLNATQLDALRQIISKETEKLGDTFRAILSGVVAQKNITGDISNVKGDVTIGDRVVYNYYINDPKPVDKKLIGRPFPLGKDDKLVRTTEFEKICELLKTNKVIQIIGEKGTGKTFLLRYAFNILQGKYDLFGLFPFSEGIDFQGVLVENYTLGYLENPEIDTERKAFFAINQINNHPNKKQLLLFQDVPLFAKDSFVIDDLIHAKIILSTTEPFPDYPTIELQPFTNQQLETILDISCTPEQKQLFEQLNNNPDCATIIYRNINRKDFSDSKDTLQQITTRLSKTQGDMTIVFVDIALDVFDLTAGEKWLLLNFSLLPARQYDRDDLALLLTEARFACPDLDAAIAAFADDCDWWANYTERAKAENANTEPEFLNMRMGILRKSLTEVKKQLGALMQDFSKEKFIEYLNLDKYDSEDLSHLLQFGSEKAEVVCEYLEPFKMLRTPEGKIPQMLQDCKELSRQLKGFIGKIQDLEPDDNIVFKLQDRQGYRYFNPEGMEETDLEDILDSLSQKAWLKQGEDTYYMSRTVQQGLQAAFKKREGYQAEYLTELINSLNTMYYLQPNNRHYLAKLYEEKDAVTYIHYAGTLLSVFDKENHNQDTLALMKKLIDSHVAQRGEYHYTIADRSYEAYVDIIKYIVPENTDFKAKAHFGYAEFLSELGQPKKALTYAEQGKRIYEALYPSGHNIFGYVYNEIGIIENELGDYQRAKELFEKAMYSDKHNFGEQHLATMVRYSNLASMLRELGDYQEAKKLLEKAVGFTEQNFGKNHPNTIEIYSNLGLVLEKLKNYQGAKGLLEKVVSFHEYSLGEQHPRTAISYSNLALVLTELEDYQEAKKLLEKAIKSMKQSFGENHPKIAQIYFNLALVLEKLRNYQGAKRVLEKVIHSNEHSFGEQHPITARSYSNLATVLKVLGDYAGAQELLEKAMRSSEQNFGEAHPTTAQRYNNLAWVLIDLNEIEKAIILWEKSYAVRLKLLGEHHPYTQNVKRALEKYRPKS